VLPKTLSLWRSGGKRIMLFMGWSKIKIEVMSKILEI
jgi:hypothetical protein